MKLLKNLTDSKRFRKLGSAVIAAWAAASLSAIFWVRGSGGVFVVSMATATACVFLRLLRETRTLMVKHSESLTAIESMKHELDMSKAAADESRFDSEELNLQLERALTQARAIAYSASANQEIKSMLIDSVPSALIGVDEDGAIMEWNRVATELFDLPPERVISRSLKDTPIPWKWEHVLPAMDDCARRLCHITVEDLEYKRPEGRKGYLKMAVSPVQIDDDKLLGYMILATDETERKILETELRQSDKMRSIGQLAAGIAHEINTPTQYVGDNSRFLQEAFDDLMKIVDKYAQLHDAVKRGQPYDRLIDQVESLINDVDLEYLREEIPLASHQCLEGLERVSKIVSGMKDFAHPDSADKSETDINHLIESTVVVSRNEWKYVADLDCDLDRDLPPVSCLAGEFNQVILNIIVNAAHAIAEVIGDQPEQKGKIVVSTRRKGDWAEIRLSDTGTGIPEQIREKIFEPFFTTKGVGKGTGQGLAIAHSLIVDNHDGTLDIESEVGKGTTFIIRLPLETKLVTQRLSK